MTGYRRVVLTTREGGIRQWDWQDRAACKGVDLSVQLAFTYLPQDRGRASAQRKAAHARAEELYDAYCSHCPVIAQCRRWADSEESFNGVAAGKPYFDKPTRARKVDE